MYRLVAPKRPRATASAHEVYTIITRDKDFADIRAYPTPHTGIVIIDVPDVVTIATLVQLILDGLASPLWGNHLQIQ